MGLKTKFVSGFVLSVSVGAAINLGGIIILPTMAHAQNITFEQILANPDDLELNLNYARQQVATGELQQAAAALERLILLKPNWDAARLFYGIVLYRLDDLNGAVRELSVLEGRQLSPSQERDRVRYLALAEKHNSPFRVSARFTLGMRIDGVTERTVDDHVLNEGDETFNFDIDDNFGSAVTASDQIRLELDVGNSGNYLFLQTNDHINERFDNNFSDSAVTRLKAGAVLHGDRFIITPYTIFGTSWLHHQRFRQHYAVGVDTRWAITPQLDFLLNGRASYEDYRVTDFSSIGDRRDGWRNQVRTGFKYRMSDKQTFKVTGRYANKDAELEGFSYDEYKIDARSLTLLGDGVYLSLYGYYKRTEYEQPDGFLSNTITRDDDVYYARGSIGAPLETIFSVFDLELPDSVGDIVAQTGVSYTHQNSTINRLEKQNWSGDIMFSKRFSF